MTTKFKDIPLFKQFKFKEKTYIKGKRSVRAGQPVNAARVELDQGDCQVLTDEAFFLDSVTVEHVTT